MLVPSSKTKMPVPSNLEKVLIAQMAIDEIPTNTIRFFRSIYPHMVQKGCLNLTELGEFSNMTRQAAKKHLNKLSEHGYILRDHYRQWAFPTRFPISDPLLLAIAASL